MSPILVDTETACLFLVRMRKQEKNPKTMLAARQTIFYLARAGKLTRHGGRAPTTARWDLKELARPYAKKDPTDA